MKKTTPSALAAASIIVFSLCASQPAAAQYVWVDEKGTKQYSDMAPPASVPKSKILKEPGRAAGSVAPAPATPPAVPAVGTDAALTAEETADTAKKKGPLTTAERNAEFQKRKMEQDDKEKKAAEQARLAADKTKNCERARAYQRSLQSGERLARTDQNGERYYLNDQQRAQEAQETKRTLDECK